MVSPNHYSSAACQHCTLPSIDAKDYLHIHHATIQGLAICRRGEVFAEHSDIEKLSGVGSIYLEDCTVREVTLNVPKKAIGKITLINAVIQRALFIAAEDPENPVIVDLNSLVQHRRFLIIYENGGYSLEDISCTLNQK